MIKYRTGKCPDTEEKKPLVSLVALLHLSLARCLNLTRHSPPFCLGNVHGITFLFFLKARWFQRLPTFTTTTHVGLSNRQAAIGAQR